MSFLQSNSKVFLFTIIMMVNSITHLLEAQVTQDWVQRYNGTGNSTDDASRLIVDGSGNVYITGTSIGSGTNYDYTTIKYNGLGAQQWVTRYNFGNDGDWSRVVGVAASGNVYVAGWSNPAATSADYATVKYNSSGAQQWAQRYNAPAGQSDGAELTIDGGENIIVTGNGWGSGNMQNFYTIKYNTAGTLQWNQTYNGPANGTDSGLMIVTDASDNVYVTGYSTGSGTNFDYTTIKYNAAGTQQWVSRYNGTGSGIDIASDIKVDGSGNVYVTGRSFNGTSDDYVTIKYNAAGAQQWAQTYNGPGNGTDQARSLALDAAGNIYVTGPSTGSGTGSDYATIKYNSAGVQQWVARYNGSASGTDEANSITLDNFGNTFVTGFAANTGTGNDYATIMYDDTGAERWVQTYNGAANGNDAAKAIAVSGQCIYVLGSSDGAGSGSDYATIKYCDPSLPVSLIDFKGKLINGFVEFSWATASEINAAYFELEKSSDGVSYEKIALINCRGGEQLTRYSATDMEPLRGISYYRLSQTDLNSQTTLFSPISIHFANEHFSLYPNPASSSDILKINSLPEKMELKIYNATGHELINISNSIESTLEIHATSLAEGIYFYYLYNDEKITQTGKFIIE